MTLIDAFRTAPKRIGATKLLWNVYAYGYRSDSVQECKPEPPWLVEGLAICAPGLEPWPPPVAEPSQFWLTIYCWWAPRTFELWDIHLTPYGHGPFYRYPNASALL